MHVQQPRHLVSHIKDLRFQGVELPHARLDRVFGHLFFQSTNVAEHEILREIVHGVVQDLAGVLVASG